jgi:hypothetical protein
MRMTKNTYDDDEDDEISIDGMSFEDFDSANRKLFSILFNTIVDLNDFLTYRGEISLDCGIDY